MAKREVKGRRRLTLEELVKKTAKDFKIGVQDELILYLVAKEAKPVGIVGGSAQHIDYGPKFYIPTNRYLNSLLKEDEEKFKKILKKEIGLNYQLVGAMVTFGSHRHQVMINNHFSIGVSRDKYSLRRLLEAGNDFEYGTALGYPKGAADRYATSVNGIPWIWSNVEKILGQRNREYAEKHPEEAYLFYVPEGALHGGGLTPASGELCIGYMELVRRDNPDLARRVERGFLLRCKSSGKDRRS